MGELRYNYSQLSNNFLSYYYCSCCFCYDFMLKNRRLRKNNSIKAFYGKEKKNKKKKIIKNKNEKMDLPSAPF